MGNGLVFLSLEKSVKAFPYFICLFHHFLIYIEVLGRESICGFVLGLFFFSFCSVYTDFVSFDISCSLLRLGYMCVCFALSCTLRVCVYGLLLFTNTTHPNHTDSFNST